MAQLLLMWINLQLLFVSGELHGGSDHDVCHASSDACTDLDKSYRQKNISRNNNINSDHKCSIFGKHVLIPPVGNWTHLQVRENCHNKNTINKVSMSRSSEYIKTDGLITNDEMENLQIISCYYDDDKNGYYFNFSSGYINCFLNLTFLKNYEKGYILSADLDIDDITSKKTSETSEIKNDINTTNIWSDESLVRINKNETDIFYYLSDMSLNGKYIYSDELKDCLKMLDKLGLCF